MVDIFLPVTSKSRRECAPSGTNKRGAQGFPVNISRSSGQRLPHWMMCALCCEKSDCPLDEIGAKKHNYELCFRVKNKGAPMHITPPTHACITCF